MHIAGLNKGIPMLNYCLLCPGIIDKYFPDPRWAIYRLVELIQVIDHFFFGGWGKKAEMVDGRVHIVFLLFKNVQRVV